MTDANMIDLLTSSTGITDANWKIINIEINGMNLGKIFRNQFYSLMEKNNGDINLAIEKWVTSV